MNGVSFDDYFQHKKSLMALEESCECNGPLSNGDYAIDYYDHVRFIIFPDLVTEVTRTPIMDFICVPQETRYKLKNQYVLPERFFSKFPFLDYFYGQITIERSLSYTSCLRFSLRSSIYSDFNRLDSLIDYIKSNIHDIMSFYQELESSTFKEEATDNPMRQTMENLKKML